MEPSHAETPREMRAWSAEVSPPELKLAISKSTRDVDDYLQAIEEGAVYNNVDKISRNWESAALGVSPPVTMYTVATLYPLIMPPGQRGYKYAAPVLLGSFITLAAEITFVTRIISMTTEERANLTCSGLSDTLPLVCLMAFVCLTLTSLQRSAQWMLWVALLPTPKPEDQQKLEVLQTGIGFRKVRRVSSNLLGDEVEGYVTEVAVGGVHALHRLTMMAGGVAKVTLDLLLLFFGAAWVLQSGSDKDIIASAVSLTFISDMDGYVYRYMMTDRWKLAIESATPTLALRRTGAQDGMAGSSFETGGRRMVFIVVTGIMNCFGSWALVALLPLVSLSLYMGFCGW